MNTKHFCIPKFCHITHMAPPVPEISYTPICYYLS